jgi:hypothetical protein
MLQSRICGGKKQFHIDHCARNLRDFREIQQQRASFTSFNAMIEEEPFPPAIWHSLKSGGSGQFG